MNKDILGLFDASYEIKTKINASYYEYCDSQKNVINGLKQLSNKGILTKETISKKYNINEMDEFSTQYTYTPYPPMKLSMERISIITETIQKMRLPLNITHEEIEFILFLFTAHRTAYLTFKHQGENTGVTEPFLKLDEINRITNRDFSYLLNIISNDINDFDETKSTMLIKDKDEFILFYSEVFAYDVFRVIERHILSSLTEKQVSQYYKIRGELFEIYVENKLKKHFPNYRLHKNCYYLNNGKKYELDFVLDNGNHYYIIEVKSSKFLDENIERKQGEIERELKRSIGKGYITINNAKNYFESTTNIIIYNNQNSVNLKKKHVCGMIITLSSLKFLTGQIQKLNNSVKYFPLNLNIMDFETILSNVESEAKFYKYVLKRIEFGNEYPQLTCDVDEVDVYGYIKSGNYKDFESKILSKNIFPSANIVLTISDSQYRNQANSELNLLYLQSLQKKYLKPYQAESVKIGRNTPCPCGSGKKYKNCCL